MIWGHQELKKYIIRISYNKVILVIDTVDDEVEGTPEEIKQNVVEKLEENFQKADEIVPEEIRTLPKDTVEDIKV